MSNPVSDGGQYFCIGKHNSDLIPICFEWIKAENCINVLPSPGKLTMYNDISVIIGVQYTAGHP